MNVPREIPIISSDAGDPVALQDPNSPASIMKKAKEQQVQSGADMKFDAAAPPRVEQFENYNDSSKSILLSLFLSSSVVLILYAAAPN
jgi:hypothetical protein